MTSTRRQLLQGALTSALVLPMLRSRASAATRRGRPRYFVQLLLHGGFDGVLTTDPKRRRDLQSEVDLPYKPSAILGVGDLELGPLLKPLRDWAPRMAIVNGLAIGTANHETGYQYHSRLMTGASRRMPTALSVVGRYREGQPLGLVYVGGQSAETAFVYSPSGWFANSIVGERPDESEITLLDALQELPPDEVRVLSRSLVACAKDATLQQAYRDATISASEVEALLQALQKAKPYVRTRTSSEDEMVADQFNRIAWLLEQDLTACVYGVIRDSGVVFDTHGDNTVQQTQAAERIFPLLANFLGALSRTSNRHGNLLDNTLVMVGSELGRNPYLNAAKGKDHFPEAPMMFFGSTINGGRRAFGCTGRRMESLPVSLTTGWRGGGSSEHLALDDIGASMYHIAGIDPVVNGNRGRILPFLTGAS